MKPVFVAEPPARWARRPKLVIDASVVAARLFGETQGKEAEAQMRGRSLCAPGLIDYEVTNVALVKVRQRAISSDESQRILALYTELDIERFEFDMPSTLRIGESFALSACDAAYLWVAGHLRVPIATFDARLATAAKSYLSQLGAPDQNGGVNGLQR